jgi:hypothetical protein
MYNQQHMRGLGEMSLKEKIKFQYKLIHIN